MSAQLALFSAATAPPKVKTVHRGAVFSYQGRRYQITKIDPTWGEHGQLVAVDLSCTIVPISRIFQLDSFEARTGYRAIP